MPPQPIPHRNGRQPKSPPVFVLAIHSSRLVRHDATICFLQRLPFDVRGRMMCVSTRKEEDVWIAMVPNEWLDPDHPFNATGVWLQLTQPTSAMSSKHALMVIMFFAHAFDDMRLHDFACRDKYPEILTRRAVNDATDIFYRPGQASRNINLRIVDLETLHERFIEDWGDWVAQAPAPWKADRFLLNNTPVTVTMRYGQNQPVLVPNCITPERQSWKRDHKYDHIKQFTFSIASHISFLKVDEWEELPRAEIAAKYPIAYDSHEPDVHRPVNLLHYTFEDAFGDILQATLMDLSLAHTLFQTAQDDFGHVRNNVNHSVYPLAFTRHLGNVQADGERGCGHRRQLADPGLDSEDDENDEEYSNDEDHMDVDMPDGQQERFPPLLHAMSSQIYNAISHRLRNAAKFHEVQLGWITSSLAGTTATSLPSKNRWQRNVDRCRGDLPHIRCAQKIAGPNQPQSMRFENTYRLDVQRLPPRKHSGDVIYAEVVTPLTKSWSHPTVLGPLKEACMVLEKDVVPELFQCTTFPLTSLIENLWKKHEPNLKEGYVVDPFELETIAMLERALNYAHTGSARVLTRRLMDRAWLSLSVMQDGLPCISNSFIQAGSLSSGLISIWREKWPVHPVTRMPLTASQRSQELTYGKPHFSSYLASFTIKLAMKYMPGFDSVDKESDVVRHIAIYAAEVALKSLINDARSLVKNAVLAEITPVINKDGLDAPAAKSRKKALLQWFKSDHPLSLNPDIHPALIEAVVKPVNGIMELKATRPPTTSLIQFVEDIIKHCNTPNPRRRPPFITDGQFIHVTRAAIRKVKQFAARHGSCTEKDLEVIIRNGFITACQKLKINQVPWSEPPAQGRRGAPSTHVVHDVWMSLGAKNPTGPPTSTAIRAHNHTPAAIARRTSQHIIASDARGEWSGTDVTLKSFHTVLHKTVPPREISEADFEGASGEAYIIKSYTFAVAAYDTSKPIHVLAVIAGIACAGLLPKIFPSKEELEKRPRNSTEWTAFIRNMEWVSRETRTRGVKDEQIFIRSLALYVINMYEPNSPISMRQKSKGKDSSNKKWVAKNSEQVP
ncbi:hypothetical protein EV363DRAFT_1405218 [Boletus edulis]|nr:hypothetical protein EV363DRAFT_1405218 [Boletus edulis]